MTATLELNSARRKLLTALGEHTHEYFSHMKAWFRKRCTKEDFDTEARKLLPPESSHLHNEFLLAILNKCQTLVGFTTFPTASVSSMSPTKASSPGSGMSTNTGNSMNSVNNGSSGNPNRKTDFGDEGRLKYGPIKRKTKSSRPSFDQRFQPPSLTNGLAVLDAGNLELRDEERKLEFAFRQPTLPDISLLHGRMLVSAWESGLETGVDDDAVSFMVSAVEQFLRNLVTSLLMDRSGYRLKDNRMPFAVGNDCPNPWLLNTQRRARTDAREVVSEIVTSGDQLLKDNPGDDGELIPLVPVGEKMFKDVEHTALVDLACATSYDDGAYQKPGPVSLFDLMHTLQKNPRLIPSHTVYSLNMERLISRLHHPGRDD